MVLRPIDLQTLVQRTTEAERAQQTQQQQPATQSRQFATQFQEAQEVKRTQTQESQRPEQGKIREEAKQARRRQPFVRKQKPKVSSPASPQEQNPLTKSKVPHIIDTKA